MKLTTQLDVFERKLLRQIAAHLNQVIRKSAKPIKTQLGTLANNVIKSSATYQSIIGGPLRASLGLSDPIPRMDAVIKQIQESIQVKPVTCGVSGHGITGGLKIGILQSDFQDLIALPEAKYISHGRSGDHQINWLSWLTVEGDVLVIDDYDIDFNLNQSQIAISRSGDALMKKTPGAKWRLPQGSVHYNVTDNFLIDAFHNVNPQIEQIVATEIQSRF